LAPGRDRWNGHWKNASNCSRAISEAAIVFDAEFAGNVKGGKFQPAILVIRARTAESPLFSLFAFV